MSSARSSSTFDPHETVWADALAGSQLAPFGRRAGAFGIDLASALIIAIPLLLVEYRLRPPATRGDFVIAFNLHDIWQLIWIVIYFGGATWVWNGRTPGKRLFRLRVVSIVGPRITLWQAIERALGYGASVLEGGFGFAQFFIAKNRQCVHDRIAETVVIVDRRNGSAAAVD